MAYLDQLSPELIAQLQEAAARQGLPVVGPDGNLYYYDSNGGSYAASPEIAGSNTENYGAPLPTYDASGKVSGSRPYEPGGQYSDLMGVLSVLGVAAGGAALAGAGAGAGGAGGAGGFIGEGVASGIPAWDAAATGAGMSLGAPVSAGGLATGGFLGEAPWVATPGATALDFGAAAGAGGAAAGAAGAASGGSGIGGLLSGAGSVLGNSGLGGLIGPLLGAAVGSQGSKNETTTAKDIPEWLKPSVMGLLAQTDALRNKQMAPGYLQGYDDMRSVGQGLLNQPIAGNGVGQVPYPTTFRR